MSEGELLELHHGFGMWLRNEFRRGTYQALFNWSSTKVKASDKPL